MLFGLHTTLAQQDPVALQQRKAELESQKLELEIAQLRQDERPWLAPLLAFVGGIVATSGALWLGRRTRRGALEQVTHQKRLECYPELVKATAPLAVYFPSYTGAAPSLDPDRCRLIGRAMSNWYFDGGGLLLTRETRDLYFRLARALTRASVAKELRAPRFPDDAEAISNEKLKNYRLELKEKHDLYDVENWEFGIRLSPDGPHSVFKDYVFLQNLSSDLRTGLTDDLRSRRHPS